MFFSKRAGVDYIIAGLGNPGKKYELTRHNVGFRVIDAFSQKHGIKITRARFNALCGDGRINGTKVLLLKPSTFMNLSGGAVLAAAKYYNVSPENIVVVYDEVALAPGVVRIRADGSAGGHNGLKSIIETLGNQTFPRVKIGVGDRPRSEMDLADWVLATPSSADKKKIESRTADIFSAIELIIEDRLGEAQSRFNG